MKMNLGPKFSPEFGAGIIEKQGTHQPQNKRKQLHSALKQAKTAWEHIFPPPIQADSALNSALYLALNGMSRTLIQPDLGLRDSIQP